MLKKDKTKIRSNWLTDNDNNDYEVTDTDKARQLKDLERLSEQQLKTLAIKLSQEHTVTRREWAECIEWLNGVKDA
jgi:hypothetical protein